MTNPVVAAVILAAGGSTRLGRPKQLLPLCGRPLLASTVDLARDAPVDLRYIVLGHARDEIRSEIDLSGIEVIDNPEFATGQSASVRRAVQTVSGLADAIIFLLGDQPAVPPAVVERIVASFRESPAAIIQPRYADGPGNPVLIGRDLFDELLGLTGDSGARPILKKHRDKGRLLDFSEHARPDDVDTWEDYRRMRLKYEGVDPGERP